MPQIGVTELVLILVLILFFFGAGKLPEVGGAITRGIRELRKSQSEGEKPAKPVQAEKPEELKAG